MLCSSGLILKPKPVIGTIVEVYVDRNSSLCRRARSLIHSSAQGVCSIEGWLHVEAKRDPVTAYKPQGLF